MPTHAPEAHRSRVFELTSEEWVVLALGSAATVAIIAVVGPPQTGVWVTAGIFFTCLVVGHLCMTAQRYVAFPDLIAVACCLQWVLAPWVSQSNPPNLALFRMTLPPNEYLQYALPATVVLWLGLHLPSARKLSKTWVMPEVEPLTLRMQRTLDMTIVMALLADLYSDRLPPALAFLAYLVSSLRFVAALGWMITRTRGWQWRVGIVMILFAAMQTTGGTFYLVIHWGGFFLLVYAYMARWRWKLGLVLVAGILVMGTLQDVKPRFRQALDSGEVSGPIDSVMRLGSMMWTSVFAKDDGISADHADFGDILVRFNQGWIICRVMTHVPSQQPYAGGSTLVDAAIFSVVPRFLFPSKKEGASTVIFKTFTGIDLAPGTKMGLSIIGEMYANFGYLGGIVSTLIYGLIIGFVFRLFADRARRNPLWWAASSMVLLPSVEPGFNVEDIANHVVKAAGLLFILWKVFPPMQRVLSTAQRPAGGSEGDGEDEIDALAGAVAEP